MNGVRSTFMRKGYLTALAAAVLLAASSGTAWAQGTVSMESVTLSSPTVNEGGEATATLKFKVTAGDDGVAAGRISVGFGYHLGTGTTEIGNNSANTAAEADDFIGLGTDLNDNLVPVAISRLSAGNERNYTVTHPFVLGHDLDAEDERFRLAVDLPAIAGAGDEDGTDPDPYQGAATYTIEDDETQEYTLSIPRGNKGAIVEGADASVNVTLTADPRRTETATVPAFTVVGPRGFFANTPVDENGDAEPAVLPANIATGLGGGDAGNQGAPADLEIGSIGVMSDKNREDDAVTLQLYVGGVGSSTVVDELPITVIDDDKLPAADAITAEAADEDGKEVMEIVEGGDPVYLTITVDRGRGTDNTNFTTKEALTIDIRASGAQGGDYEVEPARLTLDEAPDRGEQSTDVDIKLWALEDEDVGAEDLVLNLVASGSDPAIGSGSSTGTFPIIIVDKTTPMVAPKTEAEAYPKIMDAMEAGAGDEGFNPGESFSVMTSDLFTVADGYTAAYGASVEGGGVSVSASGDSITVEAKSATTDGPAKVTVTATAKMAASSFIPSQTVSNIAEITFPVTVVDKALVVMLEMPANVMNGNIVEGESYDIKVSANRMVMEDTDVMIMRDRAGSDAGEDDYSVSMATIMAGYDSATAELMVTEDMMPDSGTNDNMGEQLVLFGMVNGEQTNALTFTIWDQAVPALPLFGQLLLALFLMLGGARLYRRRQG